MFKRGWIAAAAFCAAIALPTLASAQTVAYAVYGGYTNLRAGPSTSYPIIAQIAPGTGVDVLGCLETRAWCQVLVEDLEGWVYSRRLEFLYSGRRYVVPDYYSYFDAPFVTFRFGDYDRHRYRHRHRDRDRYIESDGGGDRFRRREYTGHPGGGGPGPDTISPGDTVVPDDRYTGHPGGGGPGPEDIPGDGVCPPDSGCPDRGQ
jgi:uncharacterized protein YraI